MNNNCDKNKMNIVRKQFQNYLTDYGTRKVKASTSTSVIMIPELISIGNLGVDRSDWNMVKKGQPWLLRRLQMPLLDCNHENLHCSDHWTPITLHFHIDS